MASGLRMSRTFRFVGNPLCRGSRSVESKLFPAAACVCAYTQSQTTVQWVQASKMRQTCSCDISTLARTKGCGEPCCPPCYGPHVPDHAIRVLSPAGLKFVLEIPYTQRSMCSRNGGVQIERHRICRLASHPPYTFLHSCPVPTSPLR